MHARCSTQIAFLSERRMYDRYESAAASELPPPSLYGVEKDSIASQQPAASPSQPPSQQPAPAPQTDWSNNVDAGLDSSFFFPAEDAQSSLSWNERFQSVLEMPESGADPDVRKYQLLAQLAVDFVDASKCYGR